MLIELVLGTRRSWTFRGVILHRSGHTDQIAHLSSQLCLFKPYPPSCSTYSKCHRSHTCTWRQDAGKEPCHWCLTAVKDRKKVLWEEMGRDGKRLYWLPFFGIAGKHHLFQFFERLFFWVLFQHFQRHNIVAGFPQAMVLDYFVMAWATRDQSSAFRMKSRQGLQGQCWTSHMWRCQPCPQSWRTLRWHDVNLLGDGSCLGWSSCPTTSGL